ncbi:DNA glycosylase AlkZ-like family protein [Paractinoplanes atraurantiacus]|uniref:Winged helix DNA-binding domain-containing protein n=1 Tax=Paractinoplanes atraurantiacus TaxID=1036182 RepID=A0A285K784_9ACTN|nr:crosslink repair DNA glycosylase YcaQ family protein [Actinoplanes atraurantiacus]SNY68472.1 Winged helix DNA-binding domain-containing protein [Actinoplanes atraurantiacus]
MTYTSPSLWIPGFQPMPPSDAVHELMRHYLRSCGPATPAHMARWLGAAWAPTRETASSRAAPLPEPSTVARLGHILDVQATLTVGEVTVGPHA